MRGGRRGRGRLGRPDELRVEERPDRRGAQSFQQNFAQSREQADRLPEHSPELRNLSVKLTMNPADVETTRTLSAFIGNVK